MKVAHEASLGGVKLSSVDDRIIVLGVSAGAPKETISTAALYGGDGQVVTEVRREYLDVTVTFGIRVKKFDMETRSELFDLVNQWAGTAKGGSWFRCGNRPGKRLRVRPQSLPAEGDPWQWTNSYSIVFRANEIPYWQEQEAVTAERAGSSTGNLRISVPGSTKAVVDFSFTNTGSGELNTLSVGTGTSTFSFTNLGCAVGETVRIEHSADGLLRLRIEAANGTRRSIMGKRTEGSANDLWAEPGAVSIEYSANRAGTATVSCFGRWL